jgi:hypothetical protein
MAGWPWRPTKSFLSPRISRFKDVNDVTKGCGAEDSIPLPYQVGAPNADEGHEKTRKIDSMINWLCTNSSSQMRNSLPGSSHDAHAMIVLYDKAETKANRK